MKYKKIQPIIGKNFKRVLAEKGFKNLLELCKKRKLSYGTMYPIYVGKANPNLDTIRKIATAFDMKTSDLVRELLTIS